MKVLHRRCAGLDVHKLEVVACARVFAGRKVVHEVRRFGTTTRELTALAAWLKSLQVTHVAMEATGVYWKPVWHILEADFTLILANAQHVRNVPGRKSDVNDATWIADLLAHGLIASSFVPPQPIRELRDLTRTRRQAVGEAVRHQHRIEKVLQDANIKLSSVLSDPMGVSGRRMLAAIVGGETDAIKIAELGSSRLECPRGLLVEALSGRVSEHHRYLLGWHLRMLDEIEAKIAELDARIEAQIAPFRTAVASASSARHRTSTGTLTFIGALRIDRIDAPCVLEGPINGESFLAYVEQVLVAALKPRDIVIIDNLGSHKVQAVRKTIRAAGAKLFFLPP